MQLLDMTKREQLIQAFEEFRVKAKEITGGKHISASIHDVPDDIFDNINHIEGLNCFHEKLAEKEGPFGLDLFSKHM